MLPGGEQPFPTSAKEFVALLLPCISWGLKRKFISSDLPQLINPLENDSPLLFKNKTKPTSFAFVMVSSLKVFRSIPTAVKAVGLDLHELRTEAEFGLQISISGNSTHFFFHNSTLILLCFRCLAYNHTSVSVAKCLTLEPGI